MSSGRRGCSGRRGVVEPLLFQEAVQPAAAGAQNYNFPRDVPFSLWISNDGLADGGVFSEPALVARINQRLTRQPHKAMIYPNRDEATGRIVANSYLIGGEY